MFESMQVTNTLTLVDRISEPLARINEMVDQLNVGFDRLIEKTKIIGRGNRSMVGFTTKLRAMNAEMARTAGIADTATASVSRFDEGVAASSVFARRGGGGSGGKGGSGGGHGGPHVYGGVGPVHHRFALTAGIGAAAGLGYGMYENMTLDDIISRIMLTTGVRVHGQMSMTDTYKKLRSLIQTVSTQTGMMPKETGENTLGVMQLLAGMPLKGKLSVIPEILKFAKMESIIKPGVTSHEAAQSVVEMMHQSNMYSPKELHKLLGPLLAISQVTPLNMKKITNAASYAIPTLRTAENLDPLQLLAISAVMQRSGITNTKSGTWMQAFFTRILPKTLGAGLFSTGHQTTGLQKLGLLTDNGKQTYLNKNGNIDLLKISQILHSHLEKMPISQRMTYMNWAFGTRGTRFASMFQSEQFLKQFPIVEKYIHKAMGENEMIQQYTQNSSIQKSRVLGARLTVVLQNLTEALSGPFASVLNKLNSTLESIIKWENAHQQSASSIADWSLGGLAAWAANKFSGGKLWGFAKRLGVGAVDAAEGVGLATAGAISAAGAGAAFGLSDAYRAMATGKSWSYDFANQVGAEVTGNDNFNLGVATYDLLHEDKSKPEQHGHVYLDGHKVGKIISKHQAKSGTRPPTGSNHLDGSVNLTPVNINATMIGAH